MNIKKKLLRSISLSLALAITTSLLITIFSPVSAQENIKSISQTSLIANDKANLPQMQFDLGKVLFEKADFGKAAEVWRDAAAGFERQGDKINQAWSLSLVSLALQNLGETTTSPNSYR